MLRLAIALTVVVATACTADPAEPRAGLSPMQLRESLTAECMKQRGFKYRQETPMPEPTTEAWRKRDAGEYQAMLADRGKYGFRIFAQFVFPHDAGPDGPSAVIEHPNNVITRALSNTQMQAYFTAKDQCDSQAVEKALGKNAKDTADYDAQFQADKDATLRHEVDGDAQLVRLARAYAACLKDKGRPVGDARPSRITSQVKGSIRDQLWALGRSQWPDGEPGMKYVPDLTRGEAQPYFDEEVRAALDDLECGKAFYPVYQPRANAVYKRIAWEWGLE